MCWWGRGDGFISKVLTKKNAEETHYSHIFANGEKLENI